MPLSIIQRPSPNHEPRGNGFDTPSYLILHYTGCAADQAAARFTNGDPDQPGGRLSTHYMVTEKGEIMQFVDESRRAWHAGVSSWHGITDMNSASIGIEIENLGEFGGYPDFNAGQIAAVIDLCRDILRRYPTITPFNVLGHSDIAPGRKLDPGPKFPWAKLAEHGVGVMPPDTDEYLATNDHRRTLSAIGYNPDVPMDICYQAFCAHYAPEGLSEAGPAAADVKLWAYAAMAGRE